MAEFVGSAVWMSQFLLFRPFVFTKSLVVKNNLTLIPQIWYKISNEVGNEEAIIILSYIKLY